MQLLLHHFSVRHLSLLRTLTFGNTPLSLVCRDRYHPVRTYNMAEPRQTGPMSPVAIGAAAVCAVGAMAWSVKSRIRTNERQQLRTPRTPRTPRPDKASAAVGSRLETPNSVRTLHTAVHMCLT